jgi:hypothetical protein
LRKSIDTCLLHCRKLRKQASFLCIVYHLIVIK